MDHQMQQLARLGLELQSFGTVAHGAPLSGDRY
jgi:hypothetical protein